MVAREILHQYTAIDKREAIVPALQLTLDIVDEVMPIEKADVMRAAEIAHRRHGAPPNLISPSYGSSSTILHRMSRSFGWKR